MAHISDDEYITRNGFIHSSAHGTPVLKGFNVLTDIKTFVRILPLLTAEFSVISLYMSVMLGDVHQRHRRTSWRL
jgi:hypothetical protein